MNDIQSASHKHFSCHRSKNSSMTENKFPPVKISWLFRSSPEVIFDAWIKPEIIKKWLFKSPFNEIIEVTADTSAGGAFSIVELTETGDFIDHFGRYLQVDRP